MELQAKLHVHQTLKRDQKNRKLCKLIHKILHKINQEQRTDLVLVLVHLGKVQAPPHLPQPVRKVSPYWSCRIFDKIFPFLIIIIILIGKLTGRILNKF